MCTGLELAAVSALASGAGTAMQTMEANKNASRVQRAKNQAAEAGRIRQKQYTDEAGAAFGRSSEQQGREAFDEQREEESGDIKNAFAINRVQPDYNTGFAPSAPKNVVLANKAASDEASANTDRNVNAFAGLNSYGGAMFNQDLSRNEFARLFGNISDKASGQARLLPGAISAAGNNASKSPSLFPTLLKAGGQALGAYGAAGGSLTNTVEGALPASGIGPGAPTTQYGLFMNGKPMQAFGSQMVV